MKKNFFILFLIFCSILFSNSRVSFLRPGALMRVSNYKAYNQNELFSVSLGSELISVGNILSHSSGFAINKTNLNNFSWGVSYTVLPYAGIDPTLASSDLDYEIGAHFQSVIYSAGRTNLTMGVHDLLVNNDQMIALQDLSIFLNFSNSLSFNNYDLTSLIGFGSGRLAYDPHTNYISNSSLGIYAAMKLKVPILDDWGGIDFITEFVHSGLNLGMSIPFTSDYVFNFGITHVENLSNFALQSATIPEPLQKDSPAISFGLTLNLPKVNFNARSQKVAQNYPIQFINGKIDSSLFNAGQYIYLLQDSLALLNQEVSTIAGDNVALSLKNQIYQDSLNAMILQSNINSTKHNQAMRHLSKSLRLYYQGDFKQALNEVDQAILLQPETAIAYARKGSIYYKLNQLDRATLNWNVALKLDPEYSEVRDMLNAMQDNKLRPLSTD